MQTVKSLAKLSDMRPVDGDITAFENYANHLYVGTNTGCLLYLQVEGLMEYDMRSAEAECSGSEDGVNPPPTSTSTSLSELYDDKLSEEEEDIENDMVHKSIYTSFLAFTRFPESTLTPITQIQHCQSHPLIFVLCNQRLCAFNAFDLTYLFDVPGCIGAFFIYLVEPSHTDETCEGQPSMARTNGTDETALDEFLTEETATHIIYAAPHSEKSLFVYEVDMNRGQLIRPVLKQEFPLPEPALTLVAQDGVVCVGMRHAYGVVSLAKGFTKGIPNMHGASHSPLLAFGEGGDVYMRSHHCVFTTSMANIPTTSTPYSVFTASALTSLPPIAALPTAFVDSPFQGRVYHLRDEVRAMVSRFPFFFAFYADDCDVFFVFEEEPIERLQLPGVYFAPKFTRGKRVFLAGARTLWMVTMRGIQHQLVALIERFKVEEAFEHLAAYKRDTGSLQLELEQGLRKMTGIACLKRAQPYRAMRYFGETINPRELAMHLPECIPLPCLHSKGHSAMLPSLFHTAPPIAKTQADNVGEGPPQAGCTTPLPSLQADAHDREGEDKCHTPNGGGEHYPRMAVRSNCEDWCRGSSWNLPVGGLERAWRETYETFPLMPSDLSISSYHASPCSSDGFEARRATLRSSLPTIEEEGAANHTSAPAGEVDSMSRPLHPIIRQVPNMGCVTAEEFMARCWQDFEDSILEYFSFRLSKLWKEAVVTTVIVSSGVDDFNLNKSSEISQEKLSAAQVMEYVLLVLALRQQDDRGVYRVVSTSIGLQVADCYDLLLGLGEYRILSCLLFRRGFVRDAFALLRSRVYVSSYFSPNLLSIQTHFLNGQTKACKSDGQQESLHFMIDLLLEYWQQRHGITIYPPNKLKMSDGRGKLQGLVDKEREKGVNWIPVLAPVACGVWCLPRASREKLLFHLLGIPIPSIEKGMPAPSVLGVGIEAAPRDVKSTKCSKADSNVVKTPSAHASDGWPRQVAEFYVNGIQEVTQRASSIRYDSRVWGGSPTSFDEGEASVEVISLVGPLELVCNIHTRSKDAFGANCHIRENIDVDARRAANNMLIAPNSLSEIFFLVDKMNWFALRELLSTKPNHVLCRDEEGCTALHVAFSQIMRRLKGQMADPHLSHSHTDVGGSSSLSLGDASSHGRDGKEQDQKEDKDVLLELLLSIALLLVKAGCPTAAINHYGMSCLDLLAAAGAEGYVEIVASELAAALEIKMVCTAASAL
ncbi:unnamed protein product [Phytomonas sp. Hart1]|nr:unnamed protein product [Phytomonas sp. Hart1]|eukprot:CCW71538.1 unnamed protein product [Phytomonas sp. isolate Hart1]